MNEHKIHFPKCPFVLEEYCGNMPIDIDPLINSENKFNSESISTYSDNIDQNPPPNYNKDDIPSFPLFSEPSHRSRTFLNPNWKSTDVDCNQLIDAGFFYTGK